MGKREIRPLATPKPLNRSSPKVAHVIRSRKSTNMQNFCRDPLKEFLFSRMLEIAHQRCLLGFFWGFFQRSTAKAPEPIITHNMSNDTVLRKDVPFGVRKQISNI